MVKICESIQNKLPESTLGKVAVGAASLFALSTITGVGIYFYRTHQAGNLIEATKLDPQAINGRLGRVAAEGPIAQYHQLFNSLTPTDQHKITALMQQEFLVNELKAMEELKLIAQITGQRGLPGIRSLVEELAAQAHHMPGQEGIAVRLWLRERSVGEIAHFVHSHSFSQIEHLAHIHVDKLQHLVQHLRPHMREAYSKLDELLEKCVAFPMTPSNPIAAFKAPKLP